MTAKQFDINEFLEKIKSFKKESETKYNLNKNIKESVLQDLDNLRRKSLSLHNDLVDLQKKIHKARRYLSDCEFSFDSIKNRAEKFHIDENKNEGAL